MCIRDSANTGLVFSGDSEKFITYEQNSAYENMMPGEKRVQQITLKNEDYREMKFYVRGEYTNPLGEGCLLYTSVGCIACMVLAVVLL